MLAIVAGLLHPTAHSPRVGASASAKAGRVGGITLLLALLIGLPLAGRQDSYDLILTGGHVVDPANEIDGIRDVAIRKARTRMVRPVDGDLALKDTSERPPNSVGGLSQ